MSNCRKCGVKLTDENWFKSYKEGNRICKSCENKQARERYRKNRASILILHSNYYYTHKDDINKRHRKRDFKLRKEVLTHYGGNPPKCACCGETIYEFLTIDHISGGGAEHRRKIGSGSSNVFYYWLKKNGFPKGFQVLCMNCNFAKGIYGVCPHKKEK